MALAWGGLVACGTEAGDTLETEPTASELLATRTDKLAPAFTEALYFDHCPAPEAARGATIYVSKTGPRVPTKPLGSKENPYSTISLAVKAAMPGNIILVRAGDYPEHVGITAARGARPGTPTAPIVLRGEMGGRPRILPAATNTGTLVMVSQPNWIIQNFEVDVQGRPSFGVLFDTGTLCSQLHDSVIHGGRAGGGVIANNAEFVLIDNNEIYDFFKTGTDSHGVAVEGMSRDIFVTENKIHDVSGDCVQCEPIGGRPSTLLIERNRLYASGENGVDIKACDDILVHQNVIMNFPNVAAYPWQANTSAGEAVLVHENATNVQILDNEIANAGRGVSIGGNNDFDNPVNVQIEGNLIHDIFDYAKRNNGQGIRIVKAQGVHILGNTIERTFDAGMRLAADEPNTVSGLIVYDNVLRDMRLFVRLGAINRRPGVGMDRNRYEGPQGRFTITNQLWEGDYNAWLRVLSSSSLDQFSSRSLTLSQGGRPRGIPTPLP
ncbi:right-handed parallel beta-helix repeat-containing protein [Myxococcus stipitatus]|uniref:right-handed parallel beta-helix repeat-containing protein n=1 Tax=Myxococcus stipitatus TaxID=83455 RepID=UPI001F48F1B2|nr:right-handed parallel beta-helix repeat-containing protein [Myxococcus stipitatus]MCE9672664.1 right-handed parallel beta-helix repeat-containing protein [Myxococcus stipitatus]